MGRTRLSNLQWRILREISLKNGIVLRETLRERIAEGNSRAVKKGKGIRALWVLSGTFRGNLSRSISNLVRKRWVVRERRGREIVITDLGLRILSERADVQRISCSGMSRNSKSETGRAR